MRIDLIKCGVARLARAAGLAAWLFAAFLATSCDSTEHVLLLDIHAAQPVADVQVFLSSLGRPQPRFQNAPITIPMEERDISETPARIAIEVGGPTALIAHLVGTLATGEKVVATRCYDLSVESVIDDAVILVGPLDALDVDGDTFAADPSIACQELADDGGFRPCGDSDLYLCASDLVDDCDDTNESIFPGATPQCQDGVDDDCDDDVDEACADNDNDDWTACAPGMTENCDCNDGDSTVSPTSPEVCGDSIDQDCNGEDEFCDEDGDGFRSDIDCNDADPLVFPGATETPGGECDGIDNNCNGSIDEVPECIPADLDGDGVDACEIGVADTSGCDCNDCDQGVFGGNTENCTTADGVGGGNMVDDDCDGMVDEGCLPVEEDGDGDGQIPPMDCDDGDWLTREQTGGDWLERCDDDVDQNCAPGSGASRCASDTDSDGWAEPEGCEGNADVNPDVEEVLCNAIDDDCDGDTDEILMSNSAFGCIRADDAVGAVRVEFVDDFQNCGGCRLLCDPQTADRCWDGEGPDIDGFGACDCADEDGAGACSEGDEPTCCPSTGCVDIANDFDNCGACGRACGMGETCIEGECRCGSMTGGADVPGDEDPQACPDAGAGRDIIVCCPDDGSCQDLRNPQNCGGCGFRCGDNSICDGDLGICTCDPGNFADCNGDLRTDPNNDGCEIDTQDDLNHCGECSNLCAPNNATGVCTLASCEVASCNGVFRDCDSSAFNGCEINTNNDTAHCGGCDNNCDLSNVNAHNCVGGDCQIGSCDNLFGDCDTSHPNGCEVSLRNDTNNCGRCNVTCGTSESCNNAGRCVCNGGGAGGVGDGARCTGAGVECCPGSGCQNLNNTMAHCGDCGNNCNTATSDRCQGGDCRCGSSAECGGGGDLCCSGNCRDTLAGDESNCGGCGVSCSGTCLSGSCCANNGGCVSGGSCVAGTADNACGNNGLACVNCPGSDVCVGNSCQTCEVGSNRGCASGEICGAGGTQCEECFVDGQCSGGVCVANSCQTCAVGSNRGCGGTTPFCDGGTQCRECLNDGQCAGSNVCINNECEVCRDDASNAGCSSPTPFCLNGTSCVECETTPQCGGGVCMGNMCEVCNDTSNAGCSGSTPVCIDGSSCARCDDTTNEGCSGGTSVCVGGTMCAFCDDTTNEGCSGSTPICSGGTSCVACEADGDCMMAGAGQCIAGNVCRLCDPSNDDGCTSGEVCDATGTMCAECFEDADCTMAGAGQCVSAQCQLCDPADDEGCAGGEMCVGGGTMCN